MTTKSSFRLATALFILICTGLAHGRVSAHALGQETLSRHSLIQVSDGRLSLFYSVDMAEDPTFFELQRMDYDGDGTLTEEESERYIAETAVRFSGKFNLTANNKRLDLSVIDHDLQIHLSGHDLPVLYLTYEFEAQLPADTIWDISYEDQNFIKAIGWQEVVVQVDDTVQLQQSTVAESDLSARLTAVPEDLTLNPTQHSADFVVTSETAVLASSSQPFYLSSFVMLVIAIGVTLLVHLITQRKPSRSGT